MRRHGTVERVNASNKNALCSVEGCGQRAFSKRLCQKHYDAQQHPMKSAWKNMRCRNPGEYPVEWDRFDAFLAAVGERPDPRSQLRRRDAMLPWSVANSEWWTPPQRQDSYSADQRRAYERTWRFQRKFGITVEDYDRMLAEQNGGCAICERKPDRVRRRTGKVLDLAVDHSHEDGHVRGLLCTDCNVVLGLMDDSPDLLRAAVAYLERHRRPRLVCDNGAA
jgi:Recombination endonuclease VII